MGIAENDPYELVTIARDLYGLDGSLLRYEQRGIEKLFVLRLTKPLDQVRGVTASSAHSRLTNIQTHVRISGTRVRVCATTDFVLD